MRTTIDTAGRLVIPEAVRLQIGLVPAVAEIEVDGSALRITPGDTIEFEDLELVDGIPRLPRLGSRSATTTCGTSGLPASADAESVSR